MKVLHTADWHLGKRMEQFDRTDEHQDFLNWLIDKLKSEKIDVLIVAAIFLIPAHHQISHLNSITIF